jgi:hypothetical protein
MSINPYLQTRQRILSNQGARQQKGRLLYDQSTLLREATMAKAAQLEKLKQAANSGDPNARDLYTRRQNEFNEQIRQINEFDQLKSHQFKNQIEQLRQCFMTV